MDDRHILGLKYPKFFIFILAVFIAFTFYQVQSVSPLHDHIVEWGYFGAFVAGMMFSYGFTTPLAIALFFILAPNVNIVLGGLIGGIGSLVSDFIIFKFIRKGFDDEITKLEHEPIVRYVDKKIPKSIHRYVVPVIAVILFGSPLPDELAVALLASARHVTTKAFIIYSYCSNAAGIMLFYWLGSAL